MGGVTVAKRLERLVRFVPGVAGYQDRENSRATDKQVRMRLAGEIQRLIQSLEEDKERVAGTGALLAAAPRPARGTTRAPGPHRGVRGPRLRGPLRSPHRGRRHPRPALRLRPRALRRAERGAGQGRSGARRADRPGSPPGRGRADAGSAGRLRGALRPAPAHRPPSSRARPPPTAHRCPWRSNARRSTVA